MFELSGKVTLAELRRRHPGWVWSAHRTGYGLGWYYVGTTDRRNVQVRAYSVLSDPGRSDDLFHTEWRVEEAGRPSTLLLLWRPEAAQAVS